MKKTMSFEEVFKGYPEKVIKYNKIFPKYLIGAKIIDLKYGPDADGDPQLYYIILDNGIKIGMARVYNEGPPVKELDRTERYPDGSIIRFQFHDWPDLEKES